jgi:hypothetical protein
MLMRAVPLGPKRLEIAASVAAMNKCLAKSNKSDVGLKATKKRAQSVPQGSTSADAG